MSARFRALILPELVARILYFIRDDSNALAACIQLNKLWAEESARILWADHQSETVMHRDFCTRQQCLLHTNCRLSELAKSGRLQQYARFIRHLCFIHYGTRDYSSFTDISFPMLDTLELRQPCDFCSKENPSALDVGNFNVLQFLQPRLKYFQIEISSLCGRFFKTLAVCSSPSFRDFVIEPI